MADYATEHLLGDVMALADSMEMETFDLVGHDWGGMLGWIIAARHPGRVRSLSVVSTPHPLALQQALLGGDAAQAAHGEATDSFRDARGARAAAARAPTAPAAGWPRCSPRAGSTTTTPVMYVAALAEPGALTAALNWYRAMDGVGAAGPPAGRGAHALRLVDRGRRRSAGRRRRRPPTGCRARTRFEVLENVSHWIPETAPDELSDLLMRHLGRPDLGGPP